MYNDSKYYGFLFTSRGLLTNLKRVDYLFNLFFDFYTLITLDYFLGDSGRIIQPSYKAKAITKLFNKKTESLYQNIKTDLYRSCRKEADSYYCYDVFCNSKERSIYRKSNRGPADLVRLFSADGWVTSYGGPLWAKGASFLLTEPKNKPRWIDDVMDLEHNSGFMLDKTDFVFLERKNSRFIKGKVINALDFRARATLKDLQRFCSPEVSNIVTANLSLIPKGLW